MTFDRSKLDGLAKAKSQFPGYITHIRFPNFRNMEVNCRIDFDYPVTALVGPNGSGKTSVLQALYGAPARYSTGDYWFSTEVDPISDRLDNPSRFIYGHLVKGNIRETRKARVRKLRNGKSDPNYWEPTKESPGDGMSKDDDQPPVKEVRSLDRWNPVQRDVLYINFRRELSAFDRFFYFGPEGDGKRVAPKKDVIARDSKLLRKVIDSESTTLKYGRGQKALASENRHLNPEELTAIGGILGRTYRSAQWVRHRLFKGSEGVTVRFETNHALYSEAFAGSGEIAVTSCVVQVLAAKKGTLVLLDEPEVSLHPLAQRRLLEFLMDQAVRKKIQVVFSTHSPAMIGGLPAHAIKVFEQLDSGTFRVLPESDAYTAFRRLGALEGGQVRIVCEDRLAQKVVELAVAELDDAMKSRFSIESVPGGADSILKFRLSQAMDTSEAVWWFLDGDKKLAASFTDESTIPAAASDKLATIVEREVGVIPELYLDGSQGHAAPGTKEDRLRKFMRYVKDRLRYLPRQCPEESILAAINAATRVSASRDAKAKLFEYVKAALGHSPSSDEVDHYGVMLLAERRLENADLAAIREQLIQIAKSVPTKG